MENSILYQEESKPSYSTPDSLRKLMKEISVQVLKGQPKEEDLYIFIAAYLNEQLSTRDSEEFRSQAEENVADKLPHNPTSAADSCINNLEWEKVNSAAIIIQRKFRSLNGKIKKEKPPGEPQTRHRSRTINTTIATTEATETTGIVEECSSGVSESQNILDSSNILHKASGNSVDSTSDEKEDIDIAVLRNEKTENVASNQNKQNHLYQKKGSEGNTEENISNQNENIETRSSGELFKMINHAV